MRKNLLISKITSVILAAMLAFAYTAAAVYADEPSGSGTQEEPYIVKTADELLALGEMEEVGNVRLDADIDMSGVTGKSCIIQKLTGEFDGNGHTISNLVLKGGKGENQYTPFKTGFIGELSGTVKKLMISNVSVEDRSIDSSNAVGLLAAYVPAGANAKIDNCFVSGEVVSTKSYMLFIGAFVGYIDGASGIETQFTLSNSLSNVAITCASSNYGGGIIGVMSNSISVIVDKSVVLGDVTGGTACGMVGYFRSYDVSFDIKNSYIGGKISGSNSKSYGIGYNTTALSKRSCKNFYYDNEKNKVEHSWESFQMFYREGMPKLTGYTGLATEDMKKLTIDGFENSDDFDGYPVPVWTAAPEPVPDYTFSVKFDADNNALVSVPVKGNYYIIFTAYDDENGLISLSAEKKDFKVGENQKVTPSDEFNPAGTAKIRAMLWNSPVDLCPLTEAAEK